MFEKLQTGEKIHDAPEPAAIRFTLKRLQESARLNYSIYCTLFIVYFNIKFTNKIMRIFMFRPMALLNDAILLENH